MALRTFRSNPSLGGFGSESTAPGLLRLLNAGGNDNDDANAAVADFDAFAQIIKELVDNGVDACGMSLASTTERERGKGKKKKGTAATNDAATTESQNKRVRVVIEEFSPPSLSKQQPDQKEYGDEEDDKSSKPEDYENATFVGHDGATATDRAKSVPVASDEDREVGTGRAQILRVTVSDNGCGMENIQECVEAFKSSKAGRNGTSDNNSTQQQDEPQQKESMTAGRYGIGLTLCLLHAQRLVPNSCANITSATASATHFTKASYVVDTEGDSVRCVEIRSDIAKTKPNECGTSVSILVPGGPTARLAWPRLAEYFARFRLSCSLPCSLEVMAPTLSKTPLFVRPPLEERNRQQQQQRLQEQQRPEEEEQEDDRSSTNQCPEANDNTQEEEDWGDVFDDEDKPECRGEDSVSPTQATAPQEDDKDGETVVVVTPSTKANTATKRLTAATIKLQQEQQRQDMHRAVELYLGHAVELKNVAISRQPIRIGSQPKRRTRGAKNAGPSLAICFVACGVVHDNGERDEEDDEDDSVYRELQDRQLDASSSEAATLMMVRMVNRIPLLDGAEASSCGLVQGLLLKKRVWNSFGLEVTSTGPLGQSAVQGDSHAGKLALTKLPTFQVHDSDQVAPFFKSANHALFEDTFDEEPEEEEEDSDLDIDIEDVLRRQGKRKRKKRRNWLLPAGIRLGKILVVMQIDAEPSTLPLPTLSKGRLPLDNAAIDKALEVALRECLRSLQKTNPDILLTAQQLKRAERDARYVPAVAASLASIISKSTDSSFRSSMTELIREWDSSRAQAEGDGGVDGADGSDDEEERGDGDDGEDGPRNEEEKTEDDVHDSGSSQDETVRRADDDDGPDRAVPPDENEEEDEGAAESQANNDSQTNRSAHAIQSLVREIGCRIEKRLQQLLAAHEEEAASKKKKGKNAKNGNDDETVDTTINEGAGNSTNDGDRDDDNSQRSDGLRSLDFSTSSNDDLTSRRHEQEQIQSDDDDSDEMSLQSPSGQNQRHRSNNAGQNGSSVRDVFDDEDDWWPDT
ncbi:expressed unknown protein [Seminavis robusta]|uniref:Histidine kinase/HSP90-like ATPase domain-containing protein n=1 Tax=Seminavis robusta TaxID=568900 RepID=A0A9N8HEX6_9STRA|nr:expressed unknown protein [Seminavis robusta]|eukprot:Sro495_g154420.1 n/a (1032) ;mRNA; r:16728-19901